MGERVAQVRKKRGLSQRQLADMANVSSGYVSMLEQQRHIEDFGLSRIQRVADALKVSWKWLVDGDGEAPDLDEPTEATDVAH